MANNIATTEQLQAFERYWRECNDAHADVLGVTRKGVALAAYVQGCADGAAKANASWNRTISEAVNTVGYYKP